MGFNHFREVDFYIKGAEGTTIHWRDFGKLLNMTANNLVKAPSVSDLIVSPNIRLALDSDTYQYSFRNNAIKPLESFFDKMNQGLAGGVLKTIQTIEALDTKTTSPVFNPWFKYVKAWTNTEPVQLPLKFDFKIGQFGLWNAYQEVVKPIAALIIPATAKRITSFEMVGPFQGAPDLLAKILVQSARELFTNEEANSIAKSISAGVKSAIAANTYTVSIGNQFVLQAAYCTEVSVTLSTATDTDGFPISGSASLTLEGTIPPGRSFDIGFSQTSRFFNLQRVGVTGA